MNDEKEQIISKHHAGYLKDRAESDKWLPIIKEIVGIALGPRFLRISNPEEDMKHCIDLKGYSMPDVACRTRNFSLSYLKDVDFAIRSANPSGAKVELQKILEGEGKLYFYGFHDEATKTIPHWKIINLFSFRKTVENAGGVGNVGNERENQQDKGRYFVFPYKYFTHDPQFIIESSDRTNEKIQKVFKYLFR